MRTKPNSGQDYDTLLVDTSGGRFGTMHYFNGDTAFIAHNTPSGVSYVYKTIDNGLNWSTVDSAAYPINEITHSPCGRIYAACGSGRVRASNDLGASWYELSTGSSVHLYSISFVNDFTGFAGGAGSTVFRTSDRGISWTRMQVSDEILAPITKLHLTSETTGVVCGSGCIWSAGPPHLPYILPPALAFPNPTKGELTLPGKPAQLLELYDMQGRLCRTWENPPQEIDLSDFTHGIYLLRIVRSEHDVEKVRVMLSREE